MPIGHGAAAAGRAQAAVQLSAAAELSAAAAPHGVSPAACTLHKLRNGAPLGVWHAGDRQAETCGPAAPPGLHPAAEFE